jgi:hypothetical protein
MKPTNKNEDGLVCLIMKQKEATVRANKKNITDSLHKIFNSDQSLTVNIDSIKVADEEKTEVYSYNLLNYAYNKCAGSICEFELKKRSCFI